MSRSGKYPRTIYLAISFIAKEAIVTGTIRRKDWLRNLNWFNQDIKNKFNTISWEELRTVIKNMHIKYKKETDHKGYEKFIALGEKYILSCK